MQWKLLSSLDDVQRIKDLSLRKPQVIFKHSTTCSISAMAKMRLEDKWSEVAVDSDFNYLDLLSHRKISTHIAEQLDVYHESPQVILLIDGEVIYDASHFDISIDELNETLNHHLAK